MYSQCKAWLNQDLQSRTMKRDLPTNTSNCAPRSYDSHSAPIPKTQVSGLNPGQKTKSLIPKTPGNLQHQSC